MRTRRSVAATWTATVAFSILLATVGTTPTGAADDLETRHTGRFEGITGSSATGSVSVTSSARGADVALAVTGTSPGRPHPVAFHRSEDPAARCPRPTDDRDGDGFVVGAELERVVGPAIRTVTPDGDLDPGSLFVLDRAPTADAAGDLTMRSDLAAPTDLREEFGSIQVVVYGQDLNFSNRYEGPGPGVPAEARIPVACARLSLAGIDLPEPYAGDRDAAGLVTRLYVAVLGRSPDPGGHAHHLDRLGRGADPVDVVWTMATSPEFERRFGPRLGGATDDWVDFVYTAVFGRRADTIGRQYWIAQLEREGLGREELLWYFADSPEYRAITGTS